MPKDDQPTFSNTKLALVKVLWLQITKKKGAVIQELELSSPSCILDLLTLLCQVILLVFLFCCEVFVRTWRLELLLNSFPQKGEWEISFFSTRPLYGLVTLEISLNFFAPKGWLRACYLTYVTVWMRCEFNKLKQYIYLLLINVFQYIGAVHLRFANTCISHGLPYDHDSGNTYIKWKCRQHNAWLCFIL